MIDWDELEALEAIQWKDTAFAAVSADYVPGEGDNPRAFIIGDAPGAQEVIKRTPFVGPVGRVLRDLMANAGLYGEARSVPDIEFGVNGAGANCWLTNAVKFKP